MMIPLRVVVVLAVAMLAGCGTSPKASYYTLTRDPLPKPASSSSSLAWIPITWLATSRWSPHAPRIASRTSGRG